MDDVKRSTVVIPEKKSKIEKIKKKYKNPNMEDSTAVKIASLEVANSILKTAGTLVGVIFVIDLIIPDPVIGLDEAALAGLTGIATTASKIVENKINDLATNGTAEMKQEEIMKLAGQINAVVTNQKANKAAKAM